MDSLPVLTYQTFAVCGVCGAHLYIPVNETEREFHESGKRSRPRVCVRPDAGSAIIESLLSIVLTFVFVAMVFSVLVWAFAQGVTSSAADQGARAGSRIGVDSVAACEARSHQAIANMLPGLSAIVSCAESAGIVSSAVEVSISGGVPPFDSTTIRAQGTARKEQAPT